MAAPARRPGLHGNGRPAERLPARAAASCPAGRSPSPTAGSRRGSCVRPQQLSDTVSRAVQSLCYRAQQPQPRSPPALTPEVRMP
ncbi:unnamed protein product [Rangifer tarandus platyrhynchus]|uniref:Uncharacterized protein n=1 Tax=Rangifer tarandus platyrhynchus TaxID=3082113 RepID=A0AC59YQ44_RANTA